MNQSPIMGIAQRADDRLEKRNGFQVAEAARLPSMGSKVSAVDILHGDKDQIVGAMKIENTDNMGVYQSACVATLIFQQFDVRGGR